MQAEGVSLRPAAWMMEVRSKTLRKIRTGIVFRGERPSGIFAMAGAGAQGGGSRAWPSWWGWRRWE